MVTPSRPHRGHRLGLPWAARKYLLGARLYYDADGEGALRNSGIARLMFLVVGGDDENWKRYLAALQKEYGPLVREKREVWRQRKIRAKQLAREAWKRAKERRREAAEALPP